MARIPRDISGLALAKLLTKFGYGITRQTGSHLRLTSTVRGSEHKVTIPEHDYIKIGTLNAILMDIAQYQGITKQQLVDKLFS